MRQAFVNTFLPPSQVLRKVEGTQSVGRGVDCVLFVDFADPRKGEIALVVELDADNLVAALNLPKKDLRKTFRVHADLFGDRQRDSFERAQGVVEIEVSWSADSKYMLARILIEGNRRVGRSKEAMAAGKPVGFEG